MDEFVEEMGMNVLLQAFFHVHHTELTAAVLERFGWKYNYFTTGHPENVRVEYIVDGVTFNKEQAAELREGERVRDPHLILNVLASEKIIPCGTYVVWTRKSMPAGRGYTFDGLKIQGHLL